MTSANMGKQKTGQTNLVMGQNHRRHPTNKKYSIYRGKEIYRKQKGMGKTCIYLEVCMLKYIKKESLLILYIHLTLHPKWVTGCCDNKKKKNTFSIHIHI